MRNLVLGSDGFIGKPLCRYLKGLGEETVEMDIKRDEFPRHDNDIGWCQLPVDGIDRVYFLAWNVGGAKYLYDPKTQLDQIASNMQILNIVMPQLMGIPFVFTSSQLAGDPDSPYGVMKRLGELWTQQSQHGISVRLWNVYGEMEEEGIRSHVVSDFIRQARKGKIDMLTDGSEFRRFVHMDDVCNALHHAFTVAGKGPYDVSTNHGRTILELARGISDVTGCEFARGDKTVPIGRIRAGAPLPGWESKVDLDDGVKRMIECGT